MSYNGAASLLSGYKPHLALLDWHNERLEPGRVGPDRAETGLCRGAVSASPFMEKEKKTEEEVVEKKKKWLL